MGENIRKITYGSILIALAMILGYVERLFPIVIYGIGFKIGISNIITVVSLYLIGPLAAFIIVAIRVILNDILFGTIQRLIFSSAGFILSFVVMAALVKILGDKINKKNIYLISAIGGVCHNIGQLIIAYIFIKNIRLFMLLPMYIIAGIIAGLIVGIISNLILRSIHWKIH